MGWSSFAWKVVSSCPLLRAEGVQYHQGVPFLHLQYEHYGSQDPPSYVKTYSDTPGSKVVSHYSPIHKSLLKLGRPLTLLLFLIYFVAFLFRASLCKTTPDLSYLYPVHYPELNHHYQRNRTIHEPVYQTYQP